MATATGIDLLRANNNTIGGTVAGAGNVISGNSGHGIALADSSSNLIQGNLVGTNATGTAALPNVAGVGIVIGAGSNNTIGGTTPGARNLISGNGVEATARHQICPRFHDDSGNLVQGNYIGTDITGTAALGTPGRAFRSSRSSRPQASTRLAARARRAQHHLRQRRQLASSAAKHTL